MVGYVRVLDMDAEDREVATREREGLTTALRHAEDALRLVVERHGYQYANDALAKVQAALAHEQIGKPTDG